MRGSLEFPSKAVDTLHATTVRSLATHICKYAMRLDQLLAPHEFNVSSGSVAAFQLLTASLIKRINSHITGVLIDLLMTSLQYPSHVTYIFLKVRHVPCTLRVASMPMQRPKCRRL